MDDDVAIEDSGGLDEARERIAALIEAVRARDDFLAVAGHELRNPMTPIVMQLDILRKALTALPGLPPRAATALERLGWAVTNYVRRTMVLLDVSRITAGRLSLTEDEVDARAVLLQVVETAEPWAERVGSTISVDAAAPLPAVMDRLALEQIADNLVSNAIKYGAGKPIHVGLCQRDGWLRLEVRDQGIGIGAADRARIFSRFERAVTQRHSGGFGIGLWLVRQLVDAQDGRINIEGAPGQGSTFIVELPLLPASASAPAPATPLNAEATAVGP